jgi:uncharacterized protein (DUF305 family)
VYWRAVKPLRARTAVSFCVVIAGLTACSGAGSDAHKQTPTSTVTSTITAVPASHNAADAAFFTALSTYYRQGVELSALASARSKNTNLASFAQQSGNAMQTDLQVMKALLMQWTDGADVAPGGDPTGTAPKGMADQDTMNKLAALNGTEFDGLWLQTAFNLHAAALDMTKGEIINGTNVDAVGLAQRLVNTEQTALDHVNQLRGQTSNG